MINILTTPFLIILIQGFITGWFLSSFEPLQNIVFKINSKNFILQSIQKILLCTKCSAFWCTLIWGGIFLPILTVPFAAMLSAFLGAIYDRLMTR
jgi:hypothetical protein